MYDIAGFRYLRIPYRVVVYDLIPGTYLDEQWIAVGATPSSNHQLSYCPPTLPDRYQRPIAMKGVVDITTSAVHLNLVFPAVTGGSNQDRPYKFNGTWTLIEIKGTPPTVPKVRRDRCG
ncbi:MAG: hypothetical protein JSS57_24165 [Proteobacteria bacterium]|nr:hypothetical protein [Pseudomonadota bacterium]